MKKVLALMLAMVLVLSLVACGGSNNSNESGEKKENTSEKVEETEVKATKDDLLKASKPLSADDAIKAYRNIAFAKSLCGNVYTFSGRVFSVQENYAEMEFNIVDENNSHYDFQFSFIGQLYLPTEELSSLEIRNDYSFVGKLSDAKTTTVTLDVFETQSTALVFEEAFLNQ